MQEQKKLSQLNVRAQCKKYGLSLWQCPQFLFLIMGIIIIAATVVTYIIGNHYINDPLLVSLIVLGLVIVLFTISFIITQSFDHLAEASRLKSEFISIVSHQLRSPLTNLRWAIDFLLSDDLGGKQKDYFKILKENSLRMSELIDNLLIVSRLEQGKFPTKKEEISLKELSEEIIKSFQPFAAASNIQVELSAQENLPKIFMDSFQIRLILENILNNAIRYTKEKGKVIVRISQKNKNLLFEAEDNGVGIPQEDKKFIFQKFFRAQNVLRYQTQGSGLGLYITKTIIENIGGKIGFESEEQKGSTFWFTLPIS